MLRPSLRSIVKSNLPLLPPLLLLLWGRWYTHNPYPTLTQPLLTCVWVPYTWVPHTCEWELCESWVKVVRQAFPITLDWKREERRRGCSRWVVAVVYRRGWWMTRPSIPILYWDYDTTLSLCIRKIFFFFPSCEVWTYDWFLVSRLMEIEAITIWVCPALNEAELLIPFKLLNLQFQILVYDACAWTDIEAWLRLTWRQQGSHWRKKQNRLRCCMYMVPHRYVK
jgi:hypothetical protein